MTKMETRAIEPALGTCKSRRSGVVDPGPRPRVVANVPSSYECEAPLAYDDQFRGSVRLSEFGFWPSGLNLQRASVS